ncbi:hypothetical protein R1sor_001405 [Riccia sorocarpa]|uniref:RCC1-like domain-containing protein n=1 Tax=Riccia sorocarpa TaxID=122646 RepID=A0ABD3GW70_9MARC
MAANESAGAEPPPTSTTAEVGLEEKKEEKVEDKQKEEDKEELKGGELLFCGCASWEHVNRKDVDSKSITTLSKPVRLTSLANIDITFIASGSASCHCVAVDVNGRCYTWGRNERGQLGHGDLLQRNSPTLVTALTRYHVLRAGAGRSHTVVTTDDGASLAFGWNKHGQLGSGSMKEEFEKLPVRSLVTEVNQVFCGAEFTVWLSSTQGSSILSAGLPQYGQLGHGTDNEYNAKEASVRLVYEPQPRPRAIAALADKNITKAACGNNHTVAVDSEGMVYTWGFGGHGRLGHKEQKDEWTPRALDLFQRKYVVPPNAVVAAGSAYSACTAVGGQLYMWGRVKPTGDNWMYPKPVMDLSGWNIRSLDSGNTSSAAAAENSCISWGTAVYGELGYGPTGPKSSAQPKKIDTLEDMHVMRVACGVGHTLFIVDRTQAPEKYEKLETFTASEYSPAEVEDEPEKPSRGGAKGAAKGKQNGKKRKTAPEPTAAPEKKPRAKRATKKKDVSESEEEEEEEISDESEEESEEAEEASEKPKGRGKSTRGRGRGRGRGSGGRGTADTKDVPKSAPAKSEETAPKRGRGRPPRKQAEAPVSAEAKSEKSNPPAKSGRGRGRPRKS